MTSVVNFPSLINDNCSTNLALESNTGVGYIGCASHKYNLAVQDMTQKYGSLVTKISGLMKNIGIQ